MIKITNEDDTQLMARYKYNHFAKAPTKKP
jgi:hypothetical protein